MRQCGGALGSTGKRGFKKTRRGMAEHRGVGGLEDVQRGQKIQPLWGEGESFS